MLCPHCKAPLMSVICKDIPAQWPATQAVPPASQPFVAAKPAEKDKSPGRPHVISVYGCPECKTLIGSVGNINNSYIGTIKIGGDDPKKPASA